MGQHQKLAPALFLCLLFKLKGFPSCGLRVGNLFIFLVARATLVQVPWQAMGRIKLIRMGKSEKKRNSCSTQGNGPGILAVELNRVLGIGSGESRVGGKF